MNEEIDKIKGKKAPEDEEKEEVEKLNIKNRKRVHFGEKKIIQLKILKQINIMIMDLLLKKVI